MIPLIGQALRLGYTAAQVLDFISNRIPGIRKGIESSRKSGYAEEDILKFLQGKISSKNPKGDQETANSLEKSYSASGLKTKEEKNRQKAKFISGALGVAGTALGAYKLYQKAKDKGSLIGNVLSKATTPNEPPGEPPFQGTTINAPTQPQGPQPTPSPMQQTPGQTIGMERQQPGEVTPGMAQEAMQQQAQKPPITQEDIDTEPKYQPEYDFLKKRNLIEKMQTMAKAGKSPEEIAAMLKKKLPMMEQEYIRTLGGGEGSLDDKLLNIANKFTHPSGKVPKPIESLDQQAGEVESEPTNLVLTKSGDLGDVKGADKKGLLVDVDGKVNKYGDQDVIESPLPQKDLASLYEELINAIPEKAKSAMINIAGYDPESKEFIFIPHSGDIYRYDNIPDEFAKKLEDAMFKAKTTGQNFYGAWSEGEESRGAGLSALIKELQAYYGGKGKEYSRKYKKIFDLLELPKQAIKEKYAKRKKAK